MTSTDNQYNLILLGRYPGKDRLVAHALAQVFGRDDAWGLQIVGVAPVIVLDALTVEQAQLIYEALAEVEAAGSKFEIRCGAIEGMSKLHWPLPPRLYGRSVAEFSVADSKASVSLIVPCPYTGQKIKLTITAQATRLTAENVLTTAVAPVAVNVSVPALPSVVSVPVTVRPPSQPNTLPSTPLPIPIPVVTPVARPPSPPIPVPVPTTLLHSPQLQRHPAPHIAIPAPAITPELQEELLPMEHFFPASPKPPSRSPPHGMTVRPTSTVIPLPDVPVLHTQSPPMPSPPKPIMLPEVTAFMPSQVSAPMDMEVFEQRVSSSGIFKAPALPENEMSAPTVSDDGNLCSVFIGKTNNVKAQQVLAELHGISVPEAARLCQKMLIAVAKNVTNSEALEIKQRFAAVNMNVRIVKLKQ
ncbi:MAG: hypothetical protein V1899_06395 [Planctomycetota bacterium]